LHTVSKHVYSHSSSNPARCTSTGRQCDGYARSTNDYQSRATAVNPVSVPQYGIPIVCISAGNVHYLEFYHYCAAPTLSTQFDREFWSRTSFQMAQSELCIQHALIALGYLNKIETGSLKDARFSFLAASEQKTLLFHYNKAVECLVKRISQPSYSPEIGLVSCMLFICIEFLRGNFETAMAHFNSGLNIMSALKRTQIPSSAQRIRFSMIEELIKPMFIRMIATGVIYGLATEQVLRTFDNPLEIQERPFVSVIEAQSSLHRIHNTVMIYIRNTGFKLLEQKPFTPEDLQHQKFILDSYYAWFRALEELERGKILSKEDMLAASSLKAAYYCMYIIVACARDTNQSIFDQHLQRFKAVIHHARSVLDSIGDNTHRSPGANFTFEISIIPFLYLTACRCRCPVTRREAISLLERNPPREGLWDAQQHAVVAKRIIEIEESELDPVTGWPVERTRIWSTIVNGNMDGNGRFAVYFAVGLWGEGRGVPPLPPQMVLSGCPNGRMWKEWIVL
jgi:hypothetical protein